MLTVQVSQEVLVMSQHRDEDQRVSCFSIERNHPSVISGDAAFASATSYSSSSKGKNMEEHLLHVLQVQNIYIWKGLQLPVWGRKVVRILLAIYLKMRGSCPSSVLQWFNLKLEEIKNKLHKDFKQRSPTTFPERKVTILQTVHHTLMQEWLRGLDGVLRCD